MIVDFKDAKKIVIKIGSSLLVADGKLREKWLQNFAKNVAQLMKKKVEVVIVTSGAIALGKNFLQRDLTKKLSLQEKQAAAAIGQIQLMSFYRDFFKKLKIDVAQILLTAADCNSRERYENSRNTIETLLINGIIPIINENDSVAVDEIKIGDNDQLAARVAQMTNAELLILFSDIDGLYSKNPRIYKNAQIIPEVKRITLEIENMAGGAVSMVGTGGMITKIKAAKMAAAAGCNTIVTNGTLENALQELFLGEKKFTIFRSEKKSTKILKARKSWLSGLLNIKGELIVNECTREAMAGRRISLLAIGVIGVCGDFEKGSAVFIRDEAGNHIATGIANYGAADVQKIFEKNSTEVKKILGSDAKPDVVRIDNLIVV